MCCLGLSAEAVIYLSCHLEQRAEACKWNVLLGFFGRSCESSVIGVLGFRANVVLQVMPRWDMSGVISRKKAAFAQCCSGRRVKMTSMAHIWMLACKFDAGCIVKMLGKCCMHKGVLVQSAHKWRL